MTAQAPGRLSSLVGGAIQVPPRQCAHEPAQQVSPWTGAPGTAGTVVVVGAGKMGLPLAAQFASHGWHVVALDVSQAVVDSINAGESHVTDEPGLAELVAEAHASGRLRATTNGEEAASVADVVILIVPVVLDDEHRPDRRAMEGAVSAIAAGLRAGATVVFETTLPVGDTRKRYAPRLAEASGLTLGEDLFVAFSPERIYSGAALRNLNAYPKLVGGLDEASTERAAAFYRSVLDADVVPLTSAESAEMAKLVDTTYRDVNIALANEFARAADQLGVDIQEVITAANSQPYSHVHQPGIGVGGHCIPVYPHFLLDGAPSLELVATARRVNDGQVEAAVDALTEELGDLGGCRVLVLGLTYRHGVKELAYSRALPLIQLLQSRGADVLAWDPLLEPAEIERWAAPWDWGTEAPVQAIVTQTADPRWEQLDPSWFPELRVIVDGRNSLRGLSLPDRVRVRAFGVPPRGAR